MCLWAVRMWPSPEVPLVRTQLTPEAGPVGWLSTSLLSSVGWGAPLWEFVPSEDLKGPLPPALSPHPYVAVDQMALGALRMRPWGDRKG